MPVENFRCCPEDNFTSFSTNFLAILTFSRAYFIPLVSRCGTIIRPDRTPVCISCSSFCSISRLLYYFTYRCATCISPCSRNYTPGVADAGGGGGRETRVRAFMHSPCLGGVRSPWHPQYGRFASAIQEFQTVRSTARDGPSATVIIPRTIYDALSVSP